MDKCKVCDKEFKTDKGLHKHLKAHKVSMSVYYQRYFPRRDKLSGELINFKNKDYYFNTDFNSKANMALWFKENPEEAKPFSLELLNKLKVARKYKKQPCQVEMRSLMIPSIITYHQLFNVSFDRIAKEVGFEETYKYDNNDILASKTDKPNSEFVISVDTREQQPLKLSCKKIVNKLDFGDYCAMGDWYSKTFIERKGLSDFIGTMSERKRFERELDRAASLNSYVIVLVEEPLSKVLTFDKIKPRLFTRATPTFIFHQVRELIRAYDNIQFLFAKDRKTSSVLVEKILRFKEDVRFIDLQYCYDVGAL